MAPCRIKLRSRASARAGRDDRRRRPRRWWVALALAAMCLAGGSGFAPGGTAIAAEVVIVRSSDAEPYVQAEAAAREILAAKQLTVRTFAAKEVAEKGIAATINKPDLVLAVGTPAARWLQKQLPPNLPLAYCMVTNPEEAGLRQGNRAFGITTDVALADQVALITQCLPRARVVGTLYRSDASDSRAAVQALRVALPGKLHLEAVAVNEHPNVAAAIDALIDKNVDVIWSTADQRLYDTAAVRSLLLAALRKKIPVWGFSPAFVRAGALIGAGVDPRAQGAQAANLVLKWRDNPAAFANDGVQPPQQFQSAVNLIVAEQLGIDVPEDLVRRAAYVFRPEK